MAAREASCCQRSLTQIEDGADVGGEYTSIWQETTDSILLDIFSFLDATNLCHAACVCKAWKRVAYRETLWRSLLRRSVNNLNCVLPDGRYCWRNEYERIHYRVPLILSETLAEHTDEVLHVSFAHGGHLFSTTSKDSTVKVWEVGYPTRLKYSKNFRELFNWDFTQFSCFNKLDTMVLVSSVKMTELNAGRGFVAILSLLHDFEIMRVAAMNPCQLFGAWLDDLTFIGGCLEISLNMFATVTSVQIEAFEVSVSPRHKPFTEENIEESDECGRDLFTFSSEKASLIKFLTVANVPIRRTLSAGTSKTTLPRNASDDYSIETSFVGHMEGTKTTHPVSCCDKYVLSDREEIQKDHGSVVKQTTEAKYRTFAAENVVTEKEDDSIETSMKEHSLVFKEAYQIDRCSHSLPLSKTTLKPPEDFSKILIFVTGEVGVARHQLGLENLSKWTRESLSLVHTPDMDGRNSHMVVNYSNQDIHMCGNQILDKPDHLIDLDGHVTGLCLSDDHRYLFINYRPWIGKVDRTDTWATPDLSPNIEVRVIDLLTMQDTGVQYVGHKGDSPSNVCCFVFLDVSKDYVASGSEDAKGYLWDRHYRCLLGNYEHGPGVVNSVGFSPRDQEYFVTVSDDNTIKVWRSKQRIRSLQESRV